MPRIVIIGAGIKGACLSALLAHDESSSCVVLEAEKQPLGATFSNHGRLHAGTAGWNRDTVALMRRRHLGSMLLRGLGVGCAQRPAHYNFADEATAEAFAEKVQLAGIPVRSASLGTLAEWFREPGKGFEVNEYAFNPAQLALRLLGHLPENDVKWSTGVASIDRKNEEYRLRSSAGDLSADVVVNCAARWSQDIALSWRNTPQLELDDFEWAVLAARAGEIPQLDRIIVDQADGDNASVVPHGDWLTFDYKSPASRVAHAFAPSTGVVRVGRDDELLQVCVSSFPPLAGLAEVYAFRGVQARLRNAKPGSFGSIFTDAAAPGYMLAQGGQASSALLDAFDVVRLLWAEGLIKRDPAHLMRACITTESSSSPKPMRGVASMAWELCG